MRKVVIARPGGYEQLKIVDAAEPRPGPGELRIAVRAIGVNYADCVIRMGLYESREKWATTLARLLADLRPASPGDDPTRDTRQSRFADEDSTETYTCRHSPTPPPPRDE